MTLEVSTGVKDADDEHMIGFDGVKDRVGFVGVTIEAGAQIVSRHPDARELPQEFKAALEREMVFQGLRQAEGRDAIVADGFNVGGSLDRQPNRLLKFAAADSALRI